MAKDHSADLMQALIAKLYATITGRDENIKMPRNKFVSWYLPGLSFSPSDFLFCAKGLVGDSAEQTRALQHQAWTLSKLFDYIPEVGADKQFVDAAMQQTLFASTQDTISSVYGDVLRYSKVLDNKLTEQEQAKLKKFRDLLTVTKTVEDILTGEQKTVTEPGPLTLAYSAKLNDYIDAADEYTNMIVDAQAAKGNDPEAIRRVATFTNKAKFIRKRLEAAEMAWVSQGYKNEYETINAYIAQVTQKSLVLYKQDLQRKYNSALLTSAQEGAAGDFYYTTLLPGAFASSPGWTKFTFYEGDFQAHYGKETSQWGASGGINLGLFSIGASAGGSKVQVATNQKATSFRAELEFTQVPICRPWFDPGFFSMRSWTLDDAWKLSFGDKKVSNGAPTPVGRLVAYPVNALFVRNVKFTFAEADSQSNYIKSQVNGGGSVGWGPFRVGGSYSHGSERRDTLFHSEGGTLSIPGMTLIGTVNNLIPEAPNTNPAIKPEQFVGGK